MKLRSGRGLLILLIGVIVSVVLQIAATGPLIAQDHGAWGDGAPQGSFVWKPDAIPEFRLAAQPPEHSIRFEDTSLALRAIVEKLRQLNLSDAQPLGNFENVFYPFGGVDPFLFAVGAKRVISVGLERFGTPRQLRDALKNVARLEQSSSNYSKYTYIYALLNGYTSRPFVGEDLFAIAAHVWGLQVREVAYFDDGGVFATSEEAVELEHERFKNVLVRYERGGAWVGDHFYVRSNLSAHASPNWLKNYGLSESVSPILSELFRAIRVDGVAIKAPQGNRIHPGVIADLDRFGAEKIGYLGLVDDQLRNRFYLARQTLVHYPGPFGLSEADTTLQMALYRRASESEEAARQAPRGRWDRLKAFIWGDPEQDFVNRGPVTQHVKLTLSDSCERALQPFFRARNIRGHSSVSVRIYM